MRITIVTNILNKFIYECRLIDCELIERKKNGEDTSANLVRSCLRSGYDLIRQMHKIDFQVAEMMRKRIHEYEEKIKPIKTLGLEFV